MSNIIIGILVFAGAVVIFYALWLFTMEWMNREVDIS